jgi:DNA polymerase-3 subunit delta'
MPPLPAAEERPRGSAAVEPCYAASVSFDHILGQQPAIETLTRALTGGHVHHAYRFEGVEGVGKELTAIALAQALLCQDDEPLGCGHCDVCRRVAERAQTAPHTPLHPDVVYVARAMYPPETLGGRKETSSISIEQIRRVVLSRANYPPHEGRAQVFILRAAEQLSIGAANALLKTLEEPRPATYFVLLTARPDKLLDTIRSRSLPIRFGPLADAVIARILADHEVPEDRIASIVDLAGGSAAVALEASDSELGAPREQFVAQLRGAVDAPDLGAAIVLSESLGRDRFELIDDLRAVASAYVREARQAVRDAPAIAALAARRHRIVLDAIEAVERNGSAGLAVASLVASLRHAWPQRPGKPPPIVIGRR